MIRNWEANLFIFAIIYLNETVTDSTRHKTFQKGPTFISSVFQQDEHKKELLICSNCLDSFIFILVRAVCVCGLKIIGWASEKLCKQLDVSVWVTG